MSMRTPLKKARGLGSAKDGTEHFWLQRVTAVANFVLVPLALFYLLRLSGGDYETVRRSLGNPLITLLLGLLVLSGLVHMRIGMQIVIEDYIKGEGAKIVALMFNTFFTIAVGLSCIFAVLKLSFGV